ncbi:MAG: folate-binding protein YgfZ [Rhizobiaceae bacterium]|nr:folate-binding protein YgfZ [Rhizobiaceae bacterium]MCV0408065.1 folate-binding protein YgfZ [Rhizobiaceae bacterium]
MPTTHLDDRALVEIGGADAEHFLQNLITTDLDSLRAGEAKPGALLSPQGKILFDFLVSRHGESFVLDIRKDIAEDLLKRLTLYKLRARVEMAKRDREGVAVSWQDDSSASDSVSPASETGAGLRDTRFIGPMTVTRFHGESVPPATASQEDWHEFRVRNGIPESGFDYALGEVFPHDALLDQLDGVGFRKGCYVGQEVVSRMQHRGTARRRFLIASSQARLPASGATVTAAGKPSGTLGTAAGGRALALVRMDRIKDALDANAPILADEATLDLTIPAWARFDFPADASASDDA